MPGAASSDTTVSAVADLEVPATHTRHSHCRFYSYVDKDRTHHSMVSWSLQSLTDRLSCLSSQPVSNFIIFQRWLQPTWRKLPVLLRLLLLCPVSTRSNGDYQVFVLYKQNTTYQIACFNQRLQTIDSGNQIVELLPCLQIATRIYKNVSRDCYWRQEMLHFKEVNYIHLLHKEDTKAETKACSWPGCQPKLWWKTCNINSLFVYIHNSKQQIRIFMRIRMCAPLYLFHKNRKIT